MIPPQLLTAAEMDPQQLDTFLRRVYPSERCDFLAAHGRWQHVSDSNRWIAQVDGQVAAYCGVIPARVWAAGRVHEALWWVDLVVAPEFRGRGLESLFDQRVREMSNLVLGFPNEAAARIHRRHGWGVREDARVMLLPLNPPQVKMVRSAAGTRGSWFRAGAAILNPLAALWRKFLSTREAQRARRVDLDAASLAEVFRRVHCASVNTAWRDESFFQWRYGAAPHPEEYACYVCGASHYLVARHLTQPDGLRYTRVLDWFGDFDDEAAMRDLLLLAVQDAVTRGASQVTLVASTPQTRRIARRLGFIISVPFGFCWWCPSAELMSAFAGENYWTLGDSDNDAPE